MADPTESNDILQPNDPLKAAAASAKQTDRQDPQDRALDALQRMAKPQPRASNESLEGGPLDVRGQTARGSGSATGFVGMLAKGHMDSGDSRIGLAAGEASRRKYALAMAREIPSSAPQPAPPPKPTRPIKRLPAWYRGAAPLMWILALLLLAIGAWAVGALAYMREARPAGPEDVHYPLVIWNDEPAPNGGFTQGTRAMAWAMTACLPMAVILGVMGLAVHRKVKRAAAAAR